MHAPTHSGKVLVIAASTRTGSVNQALAQRIAARLDTTTGSHPTRVDRLLIRTTAGQAGIGNHDGHIAGSAPHHGGGKLDKGSHRGHRHQP